MNTLLPKRSASKEPSLVESEYEKELRFNLDNEDFTEEALLLWVEDINTGLIEFKEKYLKEWQNKPFPT